MNQNRDLRETGFQDKRLKCSLSYEKILGILLVGTVVTNWPQMRVPKPKKMHQPHCSSVRAAVEKA